MRRYLAEFLSDPRVIPLPRALWLPILHGLVLPRRSIASAEKYAKIWMPEGSPLAVHTRRLADALRANRPEWTVEHAMRYGEPSIASALARLPHEGLSVVPLYPQYSESTTETIADRLPRGTRMLRSFHDDPGYIAALNALVRRHWQAHGRAPMLLMSFHGLPKRHGEGYERECRASAALLAQALELAPAEWQVTFQSRFGYAEWLQPYTEPTLRELARRGCRRVDVVCPGFVADCLETLEEIGIAARAAFLEAGGREFHALPCLNDSPVWVEALGRLICRAGP